MRAILPVAVATLLALASATPPPKCPDENSEDVTLFPNPDDCTTYYACNAGIPWLMHCPEGLIYNTTLRICVRGNLSCRPPPSSSTGRPTITTEVPITTEWPSTTEWPGTDTTVTTVTSLVENEESHYRPTGKPTSSRPSRPPRPTGEPKPTHPSRPPRPTEEPKPTRPSRPPRPTGEPKPTRPSRPPRPTGEPTSPLPSRPPHPTDKPIPGLSSGSMVESIDNNLATVTCPSYIEADEVVLLANPHDCGSFYLCNGNIPVLMRCPEDLEFDPVSKQCEWSKNCRHHHHTTHPPVPSSSPGTVTPSSPDTTAPSPTTTSLF